MLSMRDVSTAYHVFAAGRNSMRMQMGGVMNHPPTTPRKGYLYPEPGERMSLYIEPAVRAAVESLAQAHGRSWSWMANRLLKQQLGQPDIEMLATLTGAQERA